MGRTIVGRILGYSGKRAIIKDSGGRWWEGSARDAFVRDVDRRKGLKEFKTDHLSMTLKKNGINIGRR